MNIHSDITLMNVQTLEYNHNVNSDMPQFSAYPIEMLVSLVFPILERIYQQHKLLQNLPHHIQDIVAEWFHHLKVSVRSFNNFK